MGAHEQIRSMKRAFITGVSGQDGSYLAELLLGKGYEVLGLVRDAQGRSHENLRNIRNDVRFVEGGLLNQENLMALIDAHRPTEVYNLAARASSKTLLSEPVLTGEVNGLAVARLLEAIRVVDPGIRVFQASSSELYGRSQESPQTELTPFRPRNAYGVAKLFAQGMVATYREHYGIFACCGILFNHESPRRPKEFVTRKITAAAAKIKVEGGGKLELGDLNATRDWGYAPDYVRGMWLMLQSDAPDDYVLATGESHSVREFCEIAFSRVGLDYRNHVTGSIKSEREADSTRLVGDATKAREVLGWKPSVSFEGLIEIMVDADSRECQASLGAVT